VSRGEELFASIGLGKVSARQVVGRLEPELAETETSEATASALGSVVRRVFRRKDSPIQVKGHDDLLVFRARCCNPIKGEPVVGYITVGRGISVHAADCPNLQHLLLNPERQVEVKWTEDGDESKYPVRLSIRTQDRTGILADITTALSSIDANIVDARARLLDGGDGLIELTVEVRDTEHLEKILNYVKKIIGVRDVERAESRSGAGNRVSQA
ncbi:MAG: GTP pyrophosphokinase, partial [Acidobacteriota bacterium]